MTTKKKLYEGKAKIIYPTDDEQVYLTYYKDSATAFNAQKKGTITDKGKVNCAIASALLTYLEKKGIPTHFIEKTSEREMLVKAVKIIPLEVVVRNIAAGSLCRETGLPEGQILPYPLVEFYLKDDALQDPLLTPDRLTLLNIATPEQITELQNLAKTINQHLIQFFQSCQITLVDFKLEFGTNIQGEILLADEISPDTCRLWDNQEQDTEKRVMDKDRFRKDLGEVESAYQKVQTRVLNQIEKLLDS